MARGALACVILYALAGPFHAVRAHRASTAGSSAEKWCTNTEAQIECDEQSVIRIKAAFYSRRQTPTCRPMEDSGTALESCAVNATDMVVDECEATRHCQVPTTSHPFCPTAPFTFIRIAWECRRGEPVLKRAELDETTLTHQIKAPADAQRKAPGLRSTKEADDRVVQVVRKTKEADKEVRLLPDRVVKTKEAKDYHGTQIRIVEHLEDQGVESTTTAAPSVAPVKVVEHVKGQGDESTTPAAPSVAPVTIVEHLEDQGDASTAPTVAPVTLYIGPSDSGTKCVKAAGITCPIDAGDQFKRVNQDHKEFGDSFHITKESNGDICARRSDKDELWALNLMLSCTVDLAQLPTDEVALVTVGPSETNTKCVWGKGFYCAPDSGDPGHRVNRDHKAFGDSFDVVQDSNSDICATRTDTNEGWSLNLLLACKMVSNPMPKVLAPGSMVVITVGQSGSREKCVGVDKGVWCAADSGNKPKRVNTDYPNAPDRFNIEMAPNGDVCATRVDEPLAWGMTLQLTCTVGKT